MMTRRTALQLGVSASFALPCGHAFAPGEFWNEKDPSSWSQKEVERLLNKSPWAKEVTLPSYGGPSAGYDDASRSGGPGGRGAGGMGGPGGGAGGGPGGGGGGAGWRGRAGDRGMEGGQGRGAWPQAKALVRWESASPIREAAHTPAPPEAAQYYVVSVRDLPAMHSGPSQWRQGPESSGARHRVEEQLKETTELQRKGKDPIHPQRVETAEKDGRRAAVYLFPRAPQAITLDDKEVTFVSGAEPIQLRVKFALKDMVYRGSLAL